jgi:AcrR family transcriptional regulator
MTTRRRDAGRARGEPIERAILDATVKELAQHGLDGLSVPRIAEMAEVNKTTIYRRWPTREELVAAALEGALHEISRDVSDTGSLAGDLRSMIRAVQRHVESPGGRALAHAAMSDRAAEAVGALSRDAALRSSGAAFGLVERAVQRGEWDPARHLPEAVFGMITGSVLHRVLLERQPLTEDWAETVVDVVTRGVEPR